MRVEFAGTWELGGGTHSHTKIITMHYPCCVCDKDLDPNELILRDDKLPKRCICEPCAQIICSTVQSVL